MKIFITGATGFIGRALILRLRRDGHSVVAWVRSLQRGRTLLGREAELVDAGGGHAAMVAAVGSCDAAINLAGAPIMGPRWTAAYKQTIVGSRIATTEALVAALAAAPRRPSVLISASAVGIYGAQRGAVVLSEGAEQGTDFLAETCQRWEAAALTATSLGVRVVLPRIGLVLGHEGGMLLALLPLFQAHLGGALGDGAQVLPWIHLHDLVDTMVAALTEARYVGPYNACSPAPVSNGAFTEALAGALGVRAPLPVPAALLRLALGEATQAALASQRAMPTALQDWGFTHRYASLGHALQQLLDPSLVDIGRRQPGDPEPLQTGHPYLRQRRPDHLLRAETPLQRPLEEVFDFFCSAENLGLMTPAAMALQIVGPPPAAMQQGLTINYTLRIGPLPLRWRTQIMHWQPPQAFVDAQEVGPYRAWWHEHHFASSGDGVRMEDRVFYAMPLGPLGTLAHVAQVRAQLQRIFWYRASAISLRFG